MCSVCADTAPCSSVEPAVFPVLSRACLGLSRCSFAGQTHLPRPPFCSVHPPSEHRRSATCGNAPLLTTVSKQKPGPTEQPGLARRTLCHSVNDHRGLSQDPHLLFRTLSCRNCPPNVLPSPIRPVISPEPQKPSFGGPALFQSSERSLACLVAFYCSQGLPESFDTDVA